MTRVVYFACVCACACACWTGNHMEVLSHSHDRAWTMAGSGDQWRYSANKLLQVQFHASVSRRFSPFTREFWPRTPRWNGLNETLFIYFLDVVTDQRELFGYMMISEWRPDPKATLKNVSFCFYLKKNKKRLNRFRNYVTRFRGRFYFVLFISVLLFSSPPPPATWNTAICPGGPGPIDDFIFYLFTKSLTALKMPWSWSWTLLFFHVLFNRNALEKKSYGAEWAVP